MKKLLLSAFLIVTTVMVDPVTLFAQEFETGVLGVTLSDYGRLRVWAPDLNTKQVERLSPLVGGLTDQVFDYYNDADTEYGAVLVDSPTMSDFELTMTQNNSYSQADPNFLVAMNIYGWTNQPYIIVKYTVTNNGTAAINAYLGAELLPEIDGSYGFETVTYLTDSNIAVIRLTDTSSQVAFMCLTHDVLTFNNIDWYDGYTTNDSDLWAWLTAGTVDASWTCTSSEGTVSFMGHGTTNLAPGASTSYYYAIAVGEDQASAVSIIGDAVTQFESFGTDIEQTESIPTEFALSQNYPNPFNPSTKISFSLPESDVVSLKVYSSLGEEIAELVNENLSAGTYSVDFNAGNLSSGIYFYTLRSGFNTITKKMLLVK